MKNGNFLHELKQHAVAFFIVSFYFLLLLAGEASGALAPTPSDPLYLVGRSAAHGDLAALKPSLPRFKVFSTPRERRSASEWPAPRPVEWPAFSSAVSASA